MTDTASPPRLQYRGQNEAGVGFAGAGEAGESAFDIARRLHQSSAVRWAQVTNELGYEVGRVDRTDCDRPCWGETTDGTLDGER